MSQLIAMLQNPLLTRRPAAGGCWAVAMTRHQCWKMLQGCMHFDTVLTLLYGASQSQHVYMTISKLMQASKVSERP